MELSLNSSAQPSTNIDTAAELKTANLVKNQQQVEGKIAVDLIESAVVDALPVIANSGHNVNVKA